MRGAAIVIAIAAFLSLMLFAALAFWQWPAGDATESGQSSSWPGAPLSFAGKGAGAAGAASDDGFLLRNFNATPVAVPDDIDRQILDVAYWRKRGVDPLLNADLVRIFEQILGRAPSDPAALLAMHVPAEYRLQAQRLLGQYMRYRDALAQLDVPAHAGDSRSNAADALQAVLAVRRALQEKYFSAEEIGGLFADDNRYDAFTVERLRLAARNDLPLTEKEAQLAGLSNELLSPAQREARQAAMLPSRIMAHNRELETMNGDERLAARSSEFGAAAAVRMAAVDRQQAEWQQRIARYADADPASRQQLRETEFTPSERLRLEAAVRLYRARP
ncbi:exported protein of unknown function [Sterolibacterium denitrificans]|uniref:Lipase helper protein n=1 Tax=Sterolibacterium denitrificans TaxID=157592 RepID=A0A7Z7HRV1_9PROT|nr:exported protein of unknown function [Sterolibacterium denitrificans]